MKKIIALIVLATISFTSLSAPVDEKKKETSTAEKKGDTPKTQSKESSPELGKNWIFGFGPAWYRDLDTSHAKSVVLGYSWGVSRSLELQGKYEFSYASSNDLDSRTDLMLIGGSYYLLDSKHSPYLSGDFGFGTFRTNEDPIYGWSVGGAIGYRFFCTSHVSAAIELKGSAFDSKISGNRPSLTTVRAVLFF